MNALLQGAYDLHIHSAPDILPRKIDDVNMAKRILLSGMKGYAIKSHYFCTSERAQIINRIYPQCKTIGAITLNNAVGGINPIAVEMAGRSGAKIVWFPTVDAENELEHLANSPPEKLPYWATIQKQMVAEGVTSTPINILKNGKLKKEVFDVLDIMARLKMVLATSHLSHTETFALLRAAAERKVDRIIITHVTHPSTFYSIDEQKELLKSGAFMEQCYTTVATGKVTWDVVTEQIRAIGVEHVVIGTDLGQATAVFPDEGLAIYGDNLLKSGFSETEIRTMIVENPESLVK